MLYPSTINGRPINVVNSSGATSLIPISPYSALSIPAYYRALDFIAENMASFPRSVHRDGSKDDSHYLNTIINRRVNKYQNVTMFWRTFFMHYGMGNGFAEVKRTSSGLVDSLHNLLPDDVLPIRVDLDDPEYRASLAKLGADIKPLMGLQQFYLVRSRQQLLPYTNCLHISRMSYDGISGLDPVKLHCATFSRAKTLEQYQTRYLQKGTVVRGSIEIAPGASEAEIDTVVNLIQKYYQGPEAERDLLVLSGAKLNNTTITPQESQLIEQAEYTDVQISQITGVAPEVLFRYDKSQYNNGIEAQGQNAVRFLLRYIIEQAEDECLKLLNSSEVDSGVTIKINPDALLRGSTKEQTDTVVAQKTAGLITINEARNILDKPGVEGDDADKLKTLGDSTPATPDTTAADPAPAPDGEAPAPAPAADLVPVGADQEISTTTESVLNGAQIQAAIALVGQVVSGLIPRDSALGMLQVLFNLTADVAEQILGSAGLHAAAQAPAAPAPAAQAAPVATAHARNALEPVLVAAVDRVEQKTAKAFQQHGSKPDKVIWCNVFSTQQARYVRESLQPVCDSIRSLGGSAPDLDTIAERYAAQVRRRAADGTPTNLLALVNSEGNG